MKKKWSFALGLLAFATVLLYLYNFFFPNDTIVITYSFFSAVLFLNAMLFIKRFNRWIMIVLLLLGLFFFYENGANFSSVITAFGNNNNLLAIFMLVPLIGIYISISGYLTSLKEKIQKVEERTTANPYRLSSILTATMGLVLNFGALVIVERIAKETFSSYHRYKLAMVALRSFGFCMLWSPYFVNVGLVLALLDVEWTAIFWIGLLIAFVYLLIVSLFFRTIRFHDDILEQNEKKKVTQANGEGSLLPLIFFASLLLATSFLLDFLLSISMLTIVALMGLFYPLIWAFFTKRGKEYVREAAIYVSTIFDRLKNEIAIFVGAGFFGAGLATTNIGTYISEFILHYSYGIVYIFSLFVILFAIMLALIGIHPVVIIVGIGSALTPELFGVSASYMAMLLLLAWVLATQLSPFSGSVLMVSGLFKLSPWRITRQNVFYVLTLTFVLSFVLYLLHVVQLI